MIRGGRGDIRERMEYCVNPEHVAFLDRLAELVAEERRTMTDLLHAGIPAPVVQLIRAYSRCPRAPDGDEELDDELDDEELDEELDHRLMLHIWFECQRVEICVGVLDTDVTTVTFDCDSVEIKRGNIGLKCKNRDGFTREARGIFADTVAKFVEVAALFCPGDPLHGILRWVTGGEI